jgi:hypothetical protein
MICSDTTKNRTGDCRFSHALDDTVRTVAEVTVLYPVDYHKILVMVEIPGIFFMPGVELYNPAAQRSAPSGIYGRRGLPRFSSM